MKSSWNLINTIKNITKKPWVLFALTLFSFVIFYFLLNKGANKSIKSIPLKAKSRAFITLPAALGPLSHGWNLTAPIDLVYQVFIYNFSVTDVGTFRIQINEYSKVLNVNEIQFDDQTLSAPVLGKTVYEVGPGAYYASGEYYSGLGKGGINYNPAAFTKSGTDIRTQWFSAMHQLAVSQSLPYRQLVAFNSCAILAVTKEPTDPSDPNYDKRIFYLVLKRKIA
jgi:hypothetical protein